MGKKNELTLYARYQFEALLESLDAVNLKMSFGAQKIAFELIDVFELTEAEKKAVESDQWNKTKKVTLSDKQKQLIATLFGSDKLGISLPFSKRNKELIDFIEQCKQVKDDAKSPA